MKRIMIACVAVAAFAAPAFAGPPATAPEGGVAGTQHNPLAYERSFAQAGERSGGASVFGSRPHGAFGAQQSELVGQINDGTAVGIEFDNYGSFLNDWKNN